LVRTSVFRLVKEGWLAAETVGRRSNYLLTPSGRRQFEEASRHIYASRAPLWDRRWRLILVAGELDARLREPLRRTLGWKGFGLVGGSGFIHPSANLADVLDLLAASGLNDALPALKPLVAADFHSSLAASDADLVAHAWDLDGLASGYAGFNALYQPILEQVRAAAPDGADGERAFLLRILLIHDYRRLLLRDPELPEVLLPAAWPGHQARLLCTELYRRLETASGRHLDRYFTLADGSVPAKDASLPERFPEFDPVGE
jgi:phenylacetic acid degradation operon negative regulatory protein